MNNPWKSVGVVRSLRKGNTRERRSRRWRRVRRFMARRIAQWSGHVYALAVGE